MEHEELIAELVGALRPYVIQGQQMRGLLVQSNELPRGVVLPQSWHLDAAEAVLARAQAVLGEKVDG